MDFTFPADDDPRRLEIRCWIADHPDPSRPQLAESGFVAPHWPEPWGRGADAETQLLIDQEFAAAEIELPDPSIGVGWAGPTILAGGDEAQIRRFLPPMLDGSEDWCQLFSEPEAGSDLASLRTQAVRDGDEYVVNGSKIWSTRADCTEWGILLVRTADEGVPQKGITYLLLDMSTPGIEVRPIQEMTGGRHFNETFFTDVRIPVSMRVGEENEGWRLAKVTLANERVSLSEGGVLWGLGPDDAQVLDRIRSMGCDDTILRQRIADLYTEMVVLRLLNQRIMSAQVSGSDPGPLSSIRKAIGDEHGQKAMALVKDLEGTSTLLDGHFPYHEEEDVWAWGHYFSRSLTIGGGTSEVQRNIIGERLLGLPREPRP
ncbi:MAG: acyl-CoA dehydrogenase family protein [Actinomycetota bacterium]|nr:acyl-CoA dehydrogenase family protein [Actinomycetota bacterium]MEC9467990.1 acyl-CoA dehydrogenase family protein [Actinomycetota bacterium]MED6328498.1 acyl-CoA dehydrogenase family protein [Actinomycetota bacterium]